MKRTIILGNLRNPLGVALTSIAVSPIFITPSWSFDPINIPRLFLVVLVACLLASFTFKREFWSKRKTDNLRNSLNLLGVLMMCSIFLTILTSPAPTLRQLFGVQGRLFGAIPLVSLIVIFLVIANSEIRLSYRALICAFGVGGVPNLLYGLIQLAGVDPIKWQNPYGPMVGFLGNPNFMSAYLGLYAVTVVSFLTKLKSRIKRQILALVILIACIYAVVKTNSIQGMFIFGIGCIVLITSKVWYSEFRKSLVILLPMICFFSFFAFLGILGSGPLSGILFQNTFKIRLFYWEAALKMIHDRPFFGFGWDTFGDWYQLYRSTESTVPHGLGLITNSVHNVYLEIGTNGGLVALILFLSLHLVIFASILRFMWRTRNEIEPQETTLLTSLWFGYIAQSLISPSSIALHIIGFTIGGLVFAATSQKYSENSSEKAANGLYLRVILSLGTTSLLIAPIAVNDFLFRNALGNRNGDVLLSTVHRWPKNDYYLVIASKIFYANNYPKIGEKLAREAREINPRNFDSLVLLLKDDSIDKNQKEIYRVELTFLDPRWKVDNFIP